MMMGSWPRDGIVRGQIDGVDFLIYENRPQSIPQMFYDSAKTNSNRLALICDDVRWTYQGLKAHVDSAALALKERWNIQKGDRIATLLSNCPEFVILYLAVTAVGGIFVPLNARLKSRELIFQIQKAAPALMFLSPENWPEVRSIKDTLTSVRSFFSVGESITETEPFQRLITGTPRTRHFPGDIKESDNFQVMRFSKIYLICLL
jgi:acyl-CoA synthetase (AMP-forming)/AMP-acid ligase II